jgi:hypothetical protein
MFLTAGLVVVGAISVLNLLLTLLVIRRLRRQGPTGMGGPMPVSGPPAGAQAPAFTGLAATGDEVSSQSLTGESSTLAFLSTDCHACASSVSHLRAYAVAAGLGPDRVIAVISGDREEGRQIIESLDGIATVVLEPQLGPITEAFSVRNFPTFVMLDDQNRVERTQLGSGPIPAKATV